MRDCNNCIYSTREGSCRKWKCEGTVTEDKLKNDVLQNFADWLVKYKVVGEIAMEELLRDYKGESDND